MKVTKAQAQENRVHIVETAAALFRERGYDRVGVAELMAAAGLRRLSQGSFKWWPTHPNDASVRLLAHELQVLICGGDPGGTKVPAAWRPVG